MDSASSTPKNRNLRRRFMSPCASSPYRSPLTCQPAKKMKTAESDMTMDELKKATKELLEKNNKLQQRIKELGEKGYKEDQLQWYIDKLHEYNEIKDVAQMVMGQIAVLQETTIREVHEDFGMTEND